MTEEILTEEIAQEDASAEEMLDTESPAPTENETLRVQLADLNEAFLRNRAEFANFKRRTEEERESLKQFLVSDVLLRLLPVADNFNRALDAARKTENYETLIGGVEGIQRQLDELLTREGVEVIPTTGETFDPNLHNAVLRDESGEHPENTVVEELQKGYTLGGKVLRPALVKVAAAG